MTVVGIAEDKVDKRSMTLWLMDFLICDFYLIKTSILCARLWTIAENASLKKLPKRVLKRALTFIAVCNKGVFKKLKIQYSVILIEYICLSYLFIFWILSLMKTDNMPAWCIFTRTFTWFFSFITDFLHLWQIVLGETDWKSFKLHN